ncbi:hypothetical protein B0T11DRAFT_327821 [Plectosphaerella cucumerina]|uniref:MYND-type domain-containing protein n=1 Tax=Plectosphaerella cucumerina TaxID=40658 RepID=A0A8K0X2Z0_9PEZI|nr:hypothetical protein B0T11DRAFT_327821 [Plectosphaerella cucumerina]
MAPPKFVCANWDPDEEGCKEIGTFTCKNCRLVLYCGSVCQKADWKRHKVLCQSPLNKESWMPAWYEEGRVPTFVTETTPQDIGPPRHLWGSAPAVDVLKLDANEGNDDLRNAFKTIAELPETRTASIDITVNDLDTPTVSRHVILLLIAVQSATRIVNVDEAVDCMLHVWYSSLIRQSDLGILEKLVKPVIQNVCDTIKTRGPEEVIKTWDGLLAYFDVPDGMTAERAHLVRKIGMLSPKMKDLRNREFVHKSGPGRVGVMRFIEDGLLLPFGSPREDFTVPNPTLFMDHQPWPMRGDNFPTNGWCTEDVFNTSSGAATSDTYGKLYYHVREVLRGFLQNMARTGATFTILQKNPAFLVDEGILAPDTFSRIHVSNFSDFDMAGLSVALIAMVPLLQTPQDNPHATLITLSKKGIADTITEKDRERYIDPNNGWAITANLYLMTRHIPPGYGPNHPRVFALGMACEALAEYDDILEGYLVAAKAAETAELVNAAAKDKHTIVPKWPFRLKLKYGETGAVEELHRLLATGHSVEFYLEWKRTA